MRPRARCARLLVPVFVLVTLAGNASAAGDEKKACALAAEQAQRLRNEGKLGEALDQLRICTRDICPAFVKSDCGPWRAEVETALPSVLVKAKDDGGEATSDVKVTVDGIVRAEKLDGEPLDVDPGAHLFHFDREGADPIEQKLVVKEGEKSRAIDLSFHLHPTNAVAAAPAAPAAAVAPPPPKAHHSLPIAGFVASGVAVAGLTVGTIFYLSAKSDIDRLKETCAPACASSQVDPIGPKIVVSDVALGVGVVAVAAAVYFFVTHDYSGKASTHVGAAAPNAAPAGLSFTF
ncbi:MAG: hypothetical protein ABI551_00160 [Polyangiaceae bacterium]